VPAAIVASIVVPDHEAEVFLANGWRLTDAPCCGGARIVPPVSVNRVPETNMAGRAGKLEPARNQITDVGYTRAGRAAQQRGR
jgi:hypothetical protein